MKNVTMDPRRQAHGTAVKVTFSGAGVDRTIHAIRFSHPHGTNYDVVVTRVSDTEVEVTTDKNWPRAGYKVFGLDHAMPPVEKFEVHPGYIID